MRSRPRRTPDYDYINRVYPDCQVIHIVRHPRDVIASNRRKYGPTGAFYGGKWVQHVRSAESDRPALGKERFRTIRYEEGLVVRPRDRSAPRCTELVGQAVERRGP